MLWQYKDKSKNDYGDGFYKIAVKLGKESTKLLREELYGFVEAEKCREFWQNKENSQNFALLNSQKQKSIKPIIEGLKYKAEWGKSTSGVISGERE